MEEVKQEQEECPIKEEPQEQQVSAAAAGGGACVKSEPTVSCVSCGQLFSSGGALTRHVWTHGGRRALRCLICRTVFSRESRLVAHHCPAPAPRRAFACSLCHHSFDSQERLDVHASGHSSCSVCGAGFAESDALILHMRSHARQTRFSCSVCGKDFTWRRHLDRHMKLHRHTKVHRYSICRHTLCRRSRLGQHRCVHRPQHEESTASDPAESEPGLGPGAEVCNGDSLQPASDDSVDSDFWKDDRKHLFKLSGQQEVKSAEQEVEPEPAEMGAGVRGPSGGTEKRFMCCECGKSFQYKYLLRRHHRSHTGEKPFCCSVCGKRFSQKENLLYHAGLHTGHKRFSCPVCQRRFNWLSGVKRHVCVPEGEDGPPPPPRPDCSPPPF